jgi:hypothetical protein
LNPPTTPEDVIVAADGDTAFVSERTGDIVQISLSTGADRSSGTVVASGLTAPHQMALDAAHGALYVVEYADPGRLVPIDFSDGAVTTAFEPLHGAVGLLLAADGRVAYVSEQTPGGGILSRLDLVAGTRQPLFTSATPQLFMMAWSDPGENAILLTERDPANTVWSIDLNTTPVHASAILTSVPERPSSVSVITPDRLLVCCGVEIDSYALTESVYTSGGPLLLGIGFVPENKIDARGLADTTTDPSYFYQVNDCPFGGTLPLMINDARAVGLGAAYCKVFVDGVLQRTPFSDYRWDTSAASPTFVLTSLGRNPNGFYTLHRSGEIWYNAWLGCFVDTSSLADDAPHTITVQIYAAADDTSEIIPDPSEITGVQPHIVNAQPVATINGIYHDDDSTPVRVCQVIDSGTDNLQFDLSAYHPTQWLGSWGL